MFSWALRGGLIARNPLARWRPLTEIPCRRRALTAFEIAALLRGSPPDLADLKTVQALLGHSTATVTLDIYAHALPGRAPEAVALIPLPESETETTTARMRRATGTDA